MKRIICCALLSICIATPSAIAEDLETIFKKVNEYVAAENYPKAMQELQWADKELQKKHSAKLGTMFPDTLVGFKGEKLKTQAMMGFKTVEKVYRKGNQQIRMTLTGGSAGAAGSMAAMGRMAAMMGGSQPGTETFRIDGRTANLTVKENRKSGELSVFLESGDLLKLELKNTAEGQAETLKAAIEEIKIVTLDNYLKGSS